MKEINKKSDWIKFTKEAFEDIKNTVGKFPHETGGILLGKREDFIVRKFVLDPNGATSPGSYDPDVNFLNKVLDEEFDNNQLSFLGFCHSHPRGVNRLSHDMGNGIGDLGYIKKIFKFMQSLDKLLVPIVFSTDDGGDFEMMPYIAYRDDVENYQGETFEIIEEDQEPIIKTEISFRKLNGSVDVSLMQETHIFGVGVGGANRIYEDLVRSGIGKLTLIDFDTVSATNLTTQGYTIKDIGKFKVDVLKESLLAINPNAEINVLKEDFLKYSEEEISLLVADVDLIMMMTDNFHAQARGNRVALKHQIPAIFAMMYKNARASEITFTIPNVTPACLRCITSSRYKAYQESSQETVESDGSTIFHTQQLNSYIGLITLAILHNDTEGYEFSNWFGQSFNRNFLQLTQHPDFGTQKESSFHRVFGGLEECFNFKTLWYEVDPESPPQYDYSCPDCGGTGNLRDAKLDSTILEPSV